MPRLGAAEITQSIKHPRQLYFYKISSLIDEWRNTRNLILQVDIATPQDYYGFF
jgi:hypothetical protein